MERSLARALNQLTKEGCDFLDRRDGPSLASYLSDYFTKDDEDLVEDDIHSGKSVLIIIIT